MSRCLTWDCWYKYLFTFKVSDTVAGHKHFILLFAIYSETAVKRKK